MKDKLERFSGFIRSISFISMIIFGISLVVILIVGVLLLFNVVRTVENGAIEFDGSIYIISTIWPLWIVAMLFAVIEFFLAFYSYELFSNIKQRQIFITKNVLNARKIGWLYIFSNVIVYAGMIYSKLFSIIIPFKHIYIPPFNAMVIAVLIFVGAEIMNERQTLPR